MPVLLRVGNVFQLGDLGFESSEERGRNEGVGFKDAVEARGLGEGQQQFSQTPDLLTWIPVLSPCCSAINSSSSRT